MAHPVATLGAAQTHAVVTAELVVQALPAFELVTSVVAVFFAVALPFEREAFA